MFLISGIGITVLVRCNSHGESCMEGSRKPRYDVFDSSVDVTQKWPLQASKGALSTPKVRTCRHGHCE